MSDPGDTINDWPSRTLPGENPFSAGVVLEGKYTIKGELGRGAMGVVYLAADDILEREVAIKALLPRYLGTKSVAKRFKPEAVAMAAVRSENVVQVFSYGEYQDHPYFVMEYIPGHTVADLIVRATEYDEFIYLDVVLGILRQVARGIDAIHDKQIIHRDIKPANMFVGPSFNVVVGDFGLVEAIDDDSQRTVVGTPFYMSPELILGSETPEYRHRSDIYALAISAYEMLVGRVPFEESRIGVVLERHIHDQPPLVSETRADIPSAVDTVLARALAKDPAERPDSCLEFVSELEASRKGPRGPKSGVRRFIVVDDDRRVRKSMTRMLTSVCPHAIVSCAPDGLQGLELAKAIAPDMIFIDLNMPHMNGIELVAALRGETTTAKIPLTVISGNLQPPDRAILESMHVEHCLDKPARLATIAEIVGELP